MEKKMTFNYFYGTEADQFSFYRIPKGERLLIRQWKERWNYCNNRFEN